MINKVLSSNSQCISKSLYFLNMGPHVYALLFTVQGTKMKTRVFLPILSCHFPSCFDHVLLYPEQGAKTVKLYHEIHLRLSRSRDKEETGGGSW